MGVWGIKILEGDRLDVLDKGRDHRQSINWSKP